jgi:hypothetical protein
MTLAVALAVPLAKAQVACHESTSPKGRVTVTCPGRISNPVGPGVQVLRCVDVDNPLGGPLPNVIGGSNLFSIQGYSDIDFGGPWNSLADACNQGACVAQQKCNPAYCF